MTVEIPDSVFSSLPIKEVPVNIYHSSSPDLGFSIGTIIFICLGIIGLAVIFCLLIHYIYTYKNNIAIEENDALKKQKENNISREKNQYDLANRILEKYWKLTSPDSSSTTPLSEEDKSHFRETWNYILTYLKERE